MSDKSPDIGKLKQLIEDAQEASANAVDAKDDERLARQRASSARNRAKDSWNGVYDYLCEIAKELRADEGFVDSKLGELLIPKRVNSVGRQVINE